MAVTHEDLDQKRLDTLLHLLDRIVSAVGGSVQARNFAEAYALVAGTLHATWGGSGAAK